MSGDQPLINNYLPLFPDIEIDIHFEMTWRNTFRCNHPLSWNPAHIPQPKLFIEK